MNVCKAALKQLKFCRDRMSGGSLFQAMGLAYAHKRYHTKTKVNSTLTHSERLKRQTRLSTLFSRKILLLNVMNMTGICTRMLSHQNQSEQHTNTQ